jgi:hypothetical protein
MPRRTSQEWQVIIEQQETSELSVVEFCKLHEVNYKYFHSRRRALSKHEQRKTSTGFVKLAQVDSRPQAILLQWDTPCCRCHPIVIQSGWPITQGIVGMKMFVEQALELSSFMDALFIWITH